MTLFPCMSFAQNNAQNAESLMIYLHGLINNTLIPLFIAMALLYTIYATVGFIASSEDSKNKEEKKQQIFWGIMGLFVIVSIWGILSIIGNTFNIFAGGTLGVN